jgi:hypothetical protein
VVAALALVLLGTVANAGVQMLTVGPADITTVATDDTYSDSGSAAENNGGSQRLVAGHLNGVTKVTYLKFTVRVPSDKAVDRVWVRLTRDLHHLPGTVSLAPTDGNAWSQSTLTAANAPGVGTPLATVHPTRDTRTVTFDVTGAVAGSGVYSFAVTSPVTDDVARFRSTEFGTDAPTLVLRVKPLPMSTTTQGPAPSATPSASPTGSPGPAPVPAQPGSCQLDGKLVPSCGLLWGVAPGAFTGTAPTQSLREYESLTGRTANVFHVYHRGDELFPTADEAAAARETGKHRLLLANWKVAWGTTWANVARGGEDARIDRLAAYIKRTYPEKFFLAIHHEPENDVSTTAGSGMTARDYAAMFRHTVQRLRADGVTNAVFVLAYMGYENWCIQSWFADLWPGDDVVDWVAYDPYLSAKPGGYLYGDFSHLVNQTSSPTRWPGFYSWAVKTHGNKPLMVAEWGVFEYTADLTRKPWIYSTVAQQVGRYPAIKALVYFDSPNAPKGDTRPNSSNPALTEFRKLAGQSMFGVPVS